MLALFRTNQFIANSLLILYALLLRSGVFFQPGAWTAPQHGVLSEWIYAWLGIGSNASASLAIFLIIFQALLINIMMSEHRIANEVTLLPGMFFVLFASCIPQFLYLSPLLMANTFYILAFMEIFKTYKKPSSAGKIYNAGLWIGIASLFYFSYIFFFALGFIALGILRAFNIKEGLMLLFGFLSSYFLIGTYSFWKGKWSIFWESQFLNNFSFLDFDFGSTPVWEWYFAFGFFLLMILITLFSYNRYVMKKNIQKQKYINILYWGLIISSLVILFQMDVRIEHIMIIVPPLSILLSFNFLSLSRPAAESIHLLLLFGILALQTKILWISG